MTPSTRVNPTMNTTLRRFLTGILPGIALLLGTSAVKADTLFYWDILNAAQSAAPYTIANSGTGGAWGTSSGITNNSSTKVSATGNTVTAAAGKDMGVSITNGAYFSFSITADANYNLTLTNLGTTMMSAQNAGVGSSGPYKVALLYSTTSNSWTYNFTNNSFTDISAGGSGTVSLSSTAQNVAAGLGGTFLATNNLTISAGNTMYFALVYMMSSNNSASSYTTWYSTNSSSNDFSILGTAQQLAAPKQLVWGGGSGDWATGAGGWLSNGAASTWAGIDSATITNNTSPTLTVSNGTTGGSLTVSNASGTVALTGGSLALSSALNKNGAGSLTSDTSLRVSGAFTNAAGATVLNASNSFSGAVVVSGGSVTANSNNVFGNGITVNGAALTLNASNAVTGTVTVTNNGSLTVGDDKAIGTNNALTVSGTVDLGGRSATVGAVTIGSGSVGNGTLTSASGYSITGGTVGASLAGAGSVSYTGTSATLSGTNTYTGVTALKNTNIGSSSVLNVASASALSANSTLIGGRNWGSSSATNPTLNLMATGLYQMKNISANSDGSGNLIFSSTNALGLTTLEFTGAGGVLNNLVEGNERGLTANNVNLVFDGQTDLNSLKSKAPVEHLYGNGNFDFAGDITAQNNSFGVANTLVANGTGTVILRGNNSGLNNTVYSFSGSSIAVTGATNLGTIANLTLGGGLIYTGGSDTFTNTLTLGGSTNAGTTAAVSLVQNGTGTVAFTGTGTATAAARTVTLSGSTAGEGSLAGAITDGAYDSTGVVTTFAGATTLSFSGAASPLTNGSLYNIGVGAAVTGAGIDSGTTVSSVVIDSTNSYIVLNKATTGNILAGQSLSFAGSTALNKSGTGTWTVSGANTYSGATTINGGTLKVNGSLKSDGTVAVNSGGTLGGSGSVGAVTVASGGTLAPGNSPGTLTVASSIWNAGGNYNWQLFDATGVAGTGYDSLSITGALDLSALSGSSKFNINLWSLSASDASGGEAINFNSSSNYSWTLATFGSLNGSFNASAFAINTGATNGTAGFANGLNGGTFGITSSNNSLFLNFTAAVISSTNVWSSTSGNLSAIGITNGSTLVMAGAGGDVTNNAQVTSLQGVTFSNTASAYTLSGSAVTNGAGGIVNNSTTSQTVSIPLILGAAQTVNAASGNLTVNGTIDNGGNLLTVNGANNTTIGGVVSGNGGLSKLGSGTAILTAANTFNGNTTVSAGTLLLSGGSIGSSSVTVNSGATLAVTGNASVGSLILNSGANSVLSVNSPSDYSQLTANGSIAFGGGLLINLSGIYTETNPLSVDILNWASKSGNFTSVDVLYNGVTTSLNNNLGDLMMWQAWLGGNGANSYFGLNLNNGTFNVVPEPSTYALFGLGLGALALTIVRRRRSA